MLRLVQIACIVVTAFILWGVKSGFQSLASWGGPVFVNGFLAGAAFMVGLYLLICWIDPSSRPRGSTAKQD